jgi:uncharacterized membrane protein YfhO
MQGKLTPATGIKIGLNEVQFVVTGDESGIAVLSDSWHPGWSVTIDGQPAQALRIGGVFRGVVVAGGSHRVHWSFQPWGWRMGKNVLMFCVFALTTPLIVARVYRF